MTPEINKNLPPQILEMLSKKGRAAYFPKLGILSQGAQAKGKEFNATLGVAKEEDDSLMTLPSVTKNINLDSETLDYVGSYGHPELRNAWKEMLGKKNPDLGETTTPIVANALTHALSIVAHLFVDEGNEIITPDLFWENYKFVFEQWPGGKLKTFTTFAEDKFNIGGLSDVLNEEGDKKILLLNFPNNPTGYTPTEEEVKELTEVIRKAADSGKKIIVICDDAYFGLVFEDGVYEQSIFTPLSNLHENVLAIKADGPTKEDYVWGLRIGFVTYAYKGMTAESASVLEEKTAGAIRGNLSNISHVGQKMLLEAYKSPEYDSEKQQKLETLKARYKKIREVIDSNPDFGNHCKALPFNSGYFMCIQLKTKKAEDLRQKLLAEYETGVIAVGEDIIRIAFSAIPLDQIPKIIDNIHQACNTET